MALRTYATGTVSVGAAGTVVTGVGTVWSGINAMEGDRISIDGSADVLITAVTDPTHLTILPWAGGAKSAVAYTIYQTYPARVVGVAAAEDVGTMLAALKSVGPIFNVPSTALVPDPSYGADGQYAVQITTGQWWLKTGGAWVLTTAPVAGYGGTSSTSLAIGTGSKVFTTQANLAYNGARVRAASIASPAANWMEGVCTYSGTTLTMTSDKTAGSGTHTDWVFTIAGQPGAAGSGGDIVSTNNGSDFASPTTVANNISAVSFGVAQTETATQRAQARKNISAILRGQLWGLTLSTAASSATFGVSIGEAADSTAVDLMSLASAYTKTTGAWAVGSGNGALDTGTIAASTWYAVFLIKRPDTGVVDILISLSATAPTLPGAGAYTLFRRIGWLRTIAGVFWKPMTQVGGKVYWTTPVVDASSLTIGTTQILITMTAPPTSVAFVRGLGYNPSALTTFIIRPTTEQDQAPGPGGYMIANEVVNGGGTSAFVIPVDSSSQIAARAATASSIIHLATWGYEDDRGRIF